MLNSSFSNQSLILFFFFFWFELLSKIKLKNKNLLYIFDRFFDSTYAYQGLSIKDKQLIQALIDLIEKKFIPKLTFYLEIDKKNLMSRAKVRSFQNKFDKTYFNQFERIQKNYNELATKKLSIRKFIKINANNSPSKIHNEVIKHLKKCKLI